MNKRTIEFLTQLAKLMETYDAELGYTIDDDGIHATVGTEEVVMGYGDAEGVRETLRGHE